MTKTKYEFSSEAWVDCAHEILIEAASDTDLSGIEVTFSEVFTDAPKHLDPDDQKAIEAVDHLSKTVASALMDMLDENRNGRIEFNEFKAHHEDILKALENMLRSAKGAIAEG